MKLATLQDGSRDGRLAVVSRDLGRFLLADGVAPTMQFAMDNWDRVISSLRELARTLDGGETDRSSPFEPLRAMAPLPRAFQFVDASAFVNHGDIMERAFNVNVQRPEGVCCMVPRQGDDFRGPLGDYVFLAEGENADYEGEFAVIVGDIPMGLSAGQCVEQIRLITILDDVSMRAHVATEMRMGFGFVRAKPAPVFGPVAVTPDELGSSWVDGRVALDLEIWRNGRLVGCPNGLEMDWSFGELLEQLAYNRNLGAGMVLGSGTVSNRDYRKVGSACIAEQRALEVLEFGSPRSSFLQHGDVVRMQALASDKSCPFGAIETRFLALSRKA